MTDFLTVRKAARLIGVGERRLHRAVRNGELPGYKLDHRTIRVATADLDVWIRNHRVEPWDPKGKRR